MKKPRRQLMLQDTKDEKVRTTRVHIKTGQKWSARKNTDLGGKNGSREAVAEMMSHQQKNGGGGASVEGKGKLTQREEL